jgi:moderate conductance mechanosensitive channel
MNISAIYAYLKANSAVSLGLGIALSFMMAVVVAVLSRRITRRLLALNRFAPKGRRISVDRQHTLQVLISNSISALAFLVALLASLAVAGVSANTIVWVVGLFSTAFGLAARPLVSDILAGISFLFNQTFDIGEKVELLLVGEKVQGVIESIGLLGSQVRAPTGELYTVPNGEIRVVRNFSRGKFSTLNIGLCVSPEDMGRSIEALKGLGDEVYNQFDGLIEPWQVLSTSGLTGGKVELTILAKAVLGQAVEIKLVLSNQIYDCFKREGIPIQ